MRRSAQLTVFGAATLALALPRAQCDPLSPHDERFGVMTHFAQGWDPAWIPVLSRASISQVRDEVYWASVEPEKGRFSFPENFDRYMAGLNANHVSPLIVLSFENPLYDDGDTPHTDEAIAAYARYAVEVLRHYGRQIKAVEIWNEYNGTFNHGPATQDRAGTYLRMLRAAYAAIKRERPDVIVVGGATSGVPLPYWEKLLSGRGLAFMDTLSIHPYRYDTPPEGMEAEIDGLQALVKKFGDGKPKPLWVTEVGWFTTAADAPGALAIDDTTQAKFLTRAFALLSSAGVERTYWYLLHDDHGLNMGLFRDDAPRTARPASLALTALVEQLRAARFVRRDRTPADFYSLAFESPTGETVRVVWSLSPTTIAAAGIISATDFLGHSIALTGQLRVDDGPIFVRGAPTGLPPAAATKIIVADSARDFSGAQGSKGWSYGTIGRDPALFTPLPDFTTSDWATSWGGAFPFVAVTATNQHPSSVEGAPVAAVRRWQSNGEDCVHITGSFLCSPKGDGVGVSILVDGHPRFRKLLGGGGGTTHRFDLVETVHPGTTIDFAVDPGPAANIDYDATTVAVTITREAP